MGHGILSEPRRRCVLGGSNCRWEALGPFKASLYMGVSQPTYIYSYISHLRTEISSHSVRCHSSLTHLTPIDIYIYNGDYMADHVVAGFNSQ